MSDLSTPNVKPKRTRTASIKKQEIVEITPEVVKKKRRRTQAPTPTQQEKTPIPPSAPIPVQEKKQDTPEPVEVKQQIDETKDVEKANPHIILKKSLPKKSTHVRKWQKMLCNVQTVGGGTNGLKVRVWVTDQKPSFKIKEKAKDQAMPPVPTAELPYVCDYPDCTKAFAKSESLKKHATLTHQIKLFKCTVDGCDRRLGSQNKLRSHLNIVHGLGKPSQERASRKEAESQRRDDSLTPEPPSET